MKGHLRRRTKGSWEITLYLGRDANGKKLYTYHTAKGTKKEAEKELRRLLHEIDTGAYIEPNRLLVSEYLERWLRDCAKSNVSPKTFERYSEIVRSNLSPALGHHKLPKLKPLHIQAFYSEALQNGRKNGKGGLSPQTVIHFHRVLREALQQAVKWQMLVRNPADAVEPPKRQTKEIQALDEEQTAKLLKAVHGTRLYIPVLIAVNTGLRRGEILALKWSDFDSQNEVLIIRRSLQQTKDGVSFKTPKTAKGRRRVELSDFVIEALKDHRKKQIELRLMLGAGYHDNDLICAFPDGSFWKPDAFTVAFREFVQSNGFEHLRFHDLRHTHATLLLLSGIHPKIVSERLGHSTVGITLDTYSHVLPGMQKEAAKVMDRLFGAANSDSQG